MMKNIAKAKIGSESRSSILWFREDFRLEDNPALWAAVKNRVPLIPVYIWTADSGDNWSLGAAAKVWLHQSLISLNSELQSVGLRLIIRQGEPSQVLDSLLQETGAKSLFWNRCYEPSACLLEKKLISDLTSKFEGLSIHTSNASLLYEPWVIKQKNGKPYQVFTAFWRACAIFGDPPPPQSKPNKFIPPKIWPDSVPLQSLKLMPDINWTEKIISRWPAGSEAARHRLKKFVQQALPHYISGRDRPDLDFVSQLSPYLRLGQIGPRQVYSAVNEVLKETNDKSIKDNCQIYLKELGWREFAYHLLFHFPHTTDSPLRSKYSKFRWRFNKGYLNAWQKGQTGYPIVDAGMRQLWQTGWMHNRVRMIVASFLVKDLLISWQYGTKWFWQTLIDADLANNSLGWQWTAGCGADAAPYFRIFNPVTQGQKFDPEGKYVKQFVPELKNLPAKYIHAPWLAGEEVLKAAKIHLGVTYPQPIINHGQARLKALAALAQMSKDSVDIEGD